MWPCACCGYLTNSESGHTSNEICPICQWKDDPIQFREPLAAGGANLVSLQEARDNFAILGVSDPLFLESVSPPDATDERDMRTRGPHESSLQSLRLTTRQRSHKLPAWNGQMSTLRLRESALLEQVQVGSNAPQEIEGQGFLEVLQAGQVSVAVRSGGCFEVQSNALVGQVEVVGRLNSARDGKLELQLNIQVSKNDTMLTSLSTEITTEPGHDVVLGIAGAVVDTKERRSAFVVRVTE